jgi:RNA polymerase sigma-70 factor (ECF subfamily)
VSQDPDRLLAAARTGDRAAIEQLLVAHLPLIHAYVRTRLHGRLAARETTLDVVQSVCRQILASPSPPEPRDLEHWKACLFAAAWNKMREQARRHASARRSAAREERSLDHDPVTVAAFLGTPSQAAIGNEVAAALQDALAALREDQREVLSLSRLAGLSHRAIGELLGRSEDAVRKLHGRALLALATELKRRGVVAEGRHAD